MSARWNLCTLLLAALFVMTASAQERESPERRRNLVVILADDFGAEGLGCYGGESWKTPRIDALAAQGIRFRNAFTQPLCTPTRLELLTGRSNARNYVAFSVLPPAERTFAELLKAGGYRTMAIGKWQLLAAEHYREDIRGTGSTPAQAGFDRHVLWQVEKLGSRHWGPTLTVDGKTRTFGEDLYGPDLALAAAKSWIDEKSDRPFCLFWPMILPHDPFIAPPGTDGPKKRPGKVAMYGPMVEYMDTLVGRLVDHLVAREIAADTLVLFIGDNGSPRKVRTRRRGKIVPGRKSRPDDHGSRVPFILWAPGMVKAPRVTDDLVSTVDVLPSLLEAAGMKVPADLVLDGQSFLQRALTGKGPKREAVTFHYHPRPKTRRRSKAQRWARDAHYQLFDDGRLYDTRFDPLCEGPLPVEAEPETRAKLERALAELPRR